MKPSEHPLWIWRRDLLLESKGRKCSVCGTKYSLHVHHNLYQRGRAYWDYEDEYLDVVCESCHEDIHNKISIGKLYNLGQSLQITRGFKKLSPMINGLRKKMIARGYDLDTCYNYLLNTGRKISCSQVEEISYLTGDSGVDVIFKLTELGVEFEQVKQEKKTKDNGN